MLPLRKPVVDASGALRLGYWKQNAALLGQSWDVPTPNARHAATCSGANYSVNWISSPDVLAHKAGLYLNATLTASGTGAVGLALGDFEAATPANAGTAHSYTYTAMLLDLGKDGRPRRAVSPHAPTALHRRTLPLRPALPHSALATS